MIDELDPCRALALGMILGALAFYVGFRIRMAIGRPRTRTQEEARALRRCACGHRYDQHGLSDGPCSQCDCIRFHLRCE